MDWINQVRGILGKYVDAQHVADASSVQRDFDELMKRAPREAIVQALAATFRDPGTGTFAGHVAHLYRESKNPEKAGLLHQLLRFAPKEASDQLLDFMPRTREITPEEAAQVPPERVARLAGEAEKKDPSVVDRIGEYYAGHPNLVKTLSVGTLTTAIRSMGSRLTERRSGGGTA